MQSGMRGIMLRQAQHKFPPENGPDSYRNENRNLIYNKQFCIFLAPRAKRRVDLLVFEVYLLDGLN